MPYIVYFILLYTFSREVGRYFLFFSQKVFKMTRAIRWLVVSVIILVLIYIFASSSSSTSDSTNEFLIRMRAKTNRTAVIMGEYTMSCHTMEFINLELTDEEKTVVDVDALDDYTVTDMVASIEARPSSYWVGRLLIFQSGLHDLHQRGLFRTWEEMFTDYKHIVQVVKLCGGQVTFWAVIPWKSVVEKAKKWNLELEEYCRQEGVGFMKDTLTHEWQDGDHLRRKSLKVWASRTVKEIRDYLYHVKDYGR